MSSSSSSDEDSDDREDYTDSVEETDLPQDGEQKCQDQQEEIELGLDSLFKECPKLDEEKLQGLESSTQRYSLRDRSGVRPPNRFSN